MKNKKFNLLRALFQLSSGRALDECNGLMHELGVKAMEDSSLPIKERVFYLPTETERATISSAQGGQEFIPAEYVSALAPYLVLSKAGARVLGGFKHGYTFPTISAINFLSKGENEDSEDGAGSVGGITLTANRLTAHLDVSKLLFLQTGDGPSKLLNDSIYAAYAAKMESVILGIGARGSDDPQGLFYKNTVGTLTKANAAVPSLTSLLALEASLDAVNAQSGQLAYITSGAGRRILQQTLKDPGGTKFLLEDEKINGFPFYFSNSVSDAAGADGLGSGLAFGKFDDLAIFNFGALEIEPDFVSLAKQYKVRLNISGFWDCKGLRGSAVTSDDASTDPDEYAVSFARCAIK